jgi:hypothetical protein
MPIHINTQVIEDGVLTLHSDPTTALGAATKQYVDNSISSAISSSGVLSFNTRTGSITLTNTDITTALTFTPMDATAVLDGGSF